MKKTIAIIVALFGATMFQLSTPSFAQTFRAAPVMGQEAMRTTTTNAAPTTTAPPTTQTGGQIQRRAGGGFRAGVTGGVRSLGYTCTADQCTCTGDTDCNDMYSGAACKWPTGPITPGDYCVGNTCYCKRA